MNTDWQTLIMTAMAEVNETWLDIVDTTLTPEDLIKPFDNGYGGSEGVPFTLWTHNHVYFPVVYDGSEWVGSVPRNPCDEASRHKGGE